MATFDLGKIRPVDKGEWNNSYPGGYDILDIVTKDSGSYMSKVASNTAPLTDRNSWIPISDPTLIEAAEALRNTNEATRQANESSRNSAETTRQNNESTRQTNETNRGSAETTRSLNETIRQTNETTRQTNETARQANETAREQLKDELITLKEETETARDNANAAADNANTAAEVANEAVAELLRPTEMTLDYPSRITYGNTAPKKIDCELYPKKSVNNMLFLGDENAVSVRPDGELFVKKPGTSIIHCIPTENTALYKTIQIQVVEPALRIVNGSSLRLMANGYFRLT